jgi:hypothetical protein
MIQSNWRVDNTTEVVVGKPHRHQARLLLFHRGIPGPPGSTVGASFLFTEAQRFAKNPDWQHFPWFCTPFGAPLDHQDHVALTQEIHRQQDKVMTEQDKIDLLGILQEFTRWVDEKTTQDVRNAPRGKNPHHW